MELCERNDLQEKIENFEDENKQLQSGKDNRDFEKRGEQKLDENQISKLKKKGSLGEEIIGELI